MKCIRDSALADAETLDRLFREIFGATFGHLYAERDLDTFLAGFTPQRWLAEMGDPRFAFQIAEIDGNAVGYAKVGPMDLPADPTGHPIELYHLYVSEPARGTGIAVDLLDWVVEKAKSMGGDELFLSVFIDNPRARRFYQRHGFTEVGLYHFMVGDQADEDMVMRLKL